MKISSYCNYHMLCEEGRRLWDSPFPVIPSDLAKPFALLISGKATKSWMCPEFLRLLHFLGLWKAVVRHQCAWQPPT